jgi:hypothetical protein
VKALPCPTPTRIHSHHQTTGSCPLHAHQSRSLTEKLMVVAPSHKVVSLDFPATGALNSFLATITLTVSSLALLTTRYCVVSATPLLAQEPLDPYYCCHQAILVSSTATAPGCIYYSWDRVSYPTAHSLSAVAVSPSFPLLSLESAKVE